jgi:peptidoglycan/xylan/chitin deacetylase (PgdA/CDA1 family)
MGLGSALHHGAIALDRQLGGLALRLGERRDGLVTLLFHSLFRDPAEASSGALSPQQATTVDDFAACIEHFLRAGYVAVTPEDLLTGVPRGQRSLLLTFDDGYWNNRRALPVLDHHRVPALFFISAGHVRDGRAFWWDALYRLRRTQGLAEADIQAELARRNLGATRENEARVREEAGADALQPRGDLDRPLTPEELREFAAHPRVRIGNHTHGHAVLGACSSEEVRRELAEAQTLLEAMTGHRPLAVAYPNGVHSPGIRATARSVGLRLGFTTEAAKEYLPQALRGDHAFRLGRHTPVAGADLAAQCLAFRSDLQISLRFTRAKKGLRRLLGRPAYGMDGQPVRASSPARRD